MRKRSWPHARSISIWRSGDRGNNSHENLETVSESGPVKYWVSLSPKTARKQTRQGSPEKVKSSQDSERR